ncbi:MAG: hypothetical protein EXX96DRAFT_533152 [Benjaminiella poitrasii]|nr:MAG: hypothetical protein EXX96DRAFT_533152 [Benjaminiella poitrasii]
MAITSNNDGQEDLIYSAPLQYDDVDSDYEITTPDAIPQVLDLDLRGIQIRLDRETLVNLPESLLIAMFPKGLVLGKHEEEEEDEDDGEAVMVTHVDFDAACLQYVLKYYTEAQKRKQDDDKESIYATTSAAQYYPSLMNKQPIIVLREELEYFCVVSCPSTINQIKLAAGEYLKSHSQVFAALQKNIARENNVAEQHLIDMLCDAGFSREDTWGYRELEPNRTCIASMSLVTLKIAGPDNHLATAQKLLLFWRKPARKCWWDGNTVEIGDKSIRLWARRTWTLELALI